jgi:uncharacterized protein YbjT (DUF2867 family)
MSTVLVTGGTGVLGAHAVSLLRERGHEVRVLSRRPGAGTHVGDLATGAGVAQAAAGAELILHAASDPSRLGRADLRQSRQLLAAASDARHLLYASIVGIDAIPFSYYRAKLACEREIEAAPVPHTVLRATQFHELLGLLLRGAERLPMVALPLAWRFQTVAAAEVAARAVELLEGAPAGRARDFGGPEVLTLGELVGIWRERRGKPRAVLPLRFPGELYRAFRDGRNTCPDHADGRRRWEEFVGALPR